MERVGDEQQVRGLQSRALACPLDMGSNIPSAANSQIRLIPEQLEGFASDIEQIRDLTRFAGRSEITRPLTAE